MTEPRESSILNQSQISIGEYGIQQYQSAFLNRHERLKIQQKEQKIIEQMKNSSKRLLSSKPRKSIAMLEEEREN